MPETIIHTPLGSAILDGGEKGLRSLRFAKDILPPSEIIPSHMEQAVKQLNTYFKGESRAFNLQLDPQGTTFQQEVWRTLNQINWGDRLSYLELATKLGNRKAVRAVAAAIGRNPLLIVIPCHRVIGGKGALTGYAGGLNRKKWLLEHEQATIQGRLF